MRDLKKAETKRRPDWFSCHFVFLTANIAILLLYTISPVLGIHPLVLKPQTVFDDDIRVSTAVLLLWIFYVFFSVLCLLCLCARRFIYVLCGHLLGKGWPLGSRLWCLTVSLSLSHWYPESGVVYQVYLIVSIPDLCTLTYSQISALITCRPWLFFG